MTRCVLFGLGFLLATVVPVQAFDCTKATTDTEKLICSNNGLKAVDDKLGDTWFTMKQEFSRTAWKALVRKQRGWLKQRDERCADGSEQQRVECLTAATQDRIAALSITPRSGSGASGAMQAFLIEKEPEPRGYKVEFHGVRFSKPQKPGETAFNAAVDKLAAEAPVNETVDFDPPGGTLDFFQSMSVNYASSRLLSVTVHTSRYDGGAHPNRYTATINMSTEDGELTFDRVFPAGAVAKLSKTCFDGLKGMGGEKLTAKQRRDALFDPKPASMHETVGNLTSWAFNERGAKVLFAPYAIGPYAAGEFECDLPLKLLRKLSKAPAYLPK